MLNVSSLESFIDEELTVQISGCEPNEEVSIETRIRDEKGNLFTCLTSYQLNTNGERTLTRSEVDQLFWKADKEKSSYGDFFYKSNARDLKIELVLKRQDSQDTSIRLKRCFYRGDILRKKIKDHGIVGTFFYSSHKQKQPVVLLLGGSDGEIQEHAAALLASKGYTVLALAYFGQSGVPKDLHRIPLEYVHQAIQWLKEQAQVEKIALIGYSRGAELALLIASIYDEFSAVVAGAPSAYVTSGLRNTIYAPIPSWTLNEQDLPYLTFKYRPAQMFSMFGGMLTRRPVSFLSIWENSLSSLEANESSRIQVENIKAPVMLIAGGDDQVWPAARFAERIKENLTEYPLECLAYEKAGHFLAFPYALPGMPANVNMHVGGGMIMNFGGTKEANAAATTDSWEKLLNFLGENAGGA
ncbi:alpha/beta fold hydrolase [Alkalicoccobacillus porphyridii]|uniref:Alpha/beta fold hydrolase n=1 Tax=Alkalicoccobacillus porphyridii TaxID=2597270 RepID=A0A553ZVN7_9BACI|nr:alpha/beta fold hydrolase [Alkalicoccobacillus porphyridii]TSB45541.1 alpha/beta fold hydrolase [Alkalicoccobacillus porphyridii]